MELYKILNNMFDTNPVNSIFRDLQYNIYTYIYIYLHIADDSYHHIILIER